MAQITYNLAELNGKLITPLQYLKKNKGQIICPDCGGDMKKSSNKSTHYFAHKNNNNNHLTHAIQNLMTPWHLNLQAMFIKKEIRIKIENGYLIADILYDDKTIIEVQNSPISYYHIEKTIELEKQGYDVIWIFNNTERIKFKTEDCKDFFKETRAKILFNQYEKLTLYRNVLINKNDEIIEEDEECLTLNDFVKDPRSVFDIVLRPVKIKKVKKEEHTYRINKLFLNEKTNTPVLKLKEKPIQKPNTTITLKSHNIKKSEMIEKYNNNQYIDYSWFNFLKINGYINKTDTWICR